MFLIASLPQELNDDILIIIGTVDLAVQYKRFWAASKICDVMMIDESNIINFIKIIPYMTLEEKNKILEIVSMFGNDINMQLLLETCRIDPSINDNKVIRLASRYQNTMVVKLLLNDSRVYQSANSDELFHWASQCGDYKIVKKLLSDHQVNRDSFNYAIDRVMQSRETYIYTNIAKLLLKDNRVDPEAKLRIASKYGYSNVVELLLKDPRVDPSSNDNEAIHLSSASGHFDVVEIVLKDPRVDPSICDNYVLYKASMCGNFTTVKLLLSDSRMNFNNDMLKYVISMSLDYDHTEVVELLSSKLNEQE